MYKNKKILAIVPARGGSKGVKLKNLREVAGIPLVAHVGNVVKEIAEIDRAIVSTDHEEIAKIAELSGLDAPFRRSEKLSGDRVGDLEVLTEALSKTEELDGVTYDIILMLQPTSPLRTPTHVIECLKKCIEGEFDSCWSVSETDSKSHPFKQLNYSDDEMSYYDNENGDKIIARQQLGKLFHRNGAVYALTRECLLEKKSMHGDRWTGLVIDSPMVSIDTEFDFKFVEFLLQNGA